jgi:ubiquinone/menaquinone biosynthesis C-methylase UbiE
MGKFDDAEDIMSLGSYRKKRNKLRKHFSLIV